MKRIINRITATISLFLLVGAVASSTVAMAGGIDVIWVGGGWHVGEVPLSDVVDYVAITGDGATPFQNLYAARVDGGIDEFWVDGSVWRKGTIPVGVDTLYIDLAADSSAPQMLYGLRATGGIDVIWVGGGWRIGAVPGSEGTTYVAITGDGATPFQNLYAARVDGGIDEFYVDGGVWRKGGLPVGVDTLYIDLAADSSAPQMLYGLRATGGIDVIWVGGGWHIDEVPLSDVVDYVAITGDGATLFQNLYAARIDGGVDEFWVEGGWRKGTIPVTTATYIGLAADVSAPQMIYGLKAPDEDGDGIPDESDECLGTLSGDVVDANGCSIAQHCPADSLYKNHGEYVSCVAHIAEVFLNAGLITDAEKDDIVSAAAKSDIGKPRK